MSDDGRTLLGAAIALRAALEKTGDALATPHLEALLESEAGLAAALAVLPRPDTGLGDERDRILQELVRVRQELTRCRRLGNALSVTMQRTLGRQLDGEGYGPDGRGSLKRAEGAAGMLQTRG